MQLSPVREQVGRHRGTGSREHVAVAGGEVAIAVESSPSLKRALQVELCEERTRTDARTSHLSSLAWKRYCVPADSPVSATRRRGPVAKRDRARTSTVRAGAATFSLGCGPPCGGSLSRTRRTAEYCRHCSMSRAHSRHLSCHLREARRVGSRARSCRRSARRPIKFCTAGQPAGARQRRASGLRSPRTGGLCMCGASARSLSPWQEPGQSRAARATRSRGTRPGRQRHSRAAPDVDQHDLALRGSSAEARGGPEARGRFCPWSDARHPAIPQ